MKTVEESERVVKYLGTYLEIKRESNQEKRTAKNGEIAKSPTTSRVGCLDETCEDGTDDNEGNTG